MKGSKYDMNAFFKLLRIVPVRIESQLTFQHIHVTMLKDDYRDIDASGKESIYFKEVI